MNLDIEPLGIAPPKPSRNRSRRQRKKLFLDEFKQFGFHVGFQMTADLPRPQAEVLWDRFIEEAIEGNKLSCGGGGSWTEAHFYVMGAYDGHRDRSATPQQRQAVLDWLEANRSNGIVDFAASDLSDANYDPVSP